MAPAWDAVGWRVWAGLGEVGGEVVRRLDWEDSTKGCSQVFTISTPHRQSPSLYLLTAHYFAPWTLVRHHVQGSRGELRSELVWGEERPASGRCHKHGVRGSAIGKGGADDVR